MKRNLEEKSESPILLESVLDIYRQLIKNFDQQMRYDVSGEFFVREMELRRKYQTKQHDNNSPTTKKNFFRKHISVIWAYNVVAQYGQSYLRPVCLIISIITSSTLYFWFGDSSTFSNSNNFEPSLDSLYNSFLRSLSGFFPFYDFDKKIQKSLVDFILRIMLLPIVGTLFVALKRKFERRFRH